MRSSVSPGIPVLAERMRYSATVIIKVPFVTFGFGNRVFIGEKGHFGVGKPFISGWGQPGTGGGGNNKG